MTLIKPYKHQIEALLVAQAKISQEENCLLEIGTAGGKSVIIALINNHLHSKGKRVLNLVFSSSVLSHNRSQTANMYKEIKTSVVCAGLGENDISGDVVFATEQSFKKYLTDDSILKQFDFIVIDEMHRINKDSMSTYQRILNTMHWCRLVGLTATPFYGSGEPTFGEDKHFKSRDFVYSIRETEEAKVTTPVYHKPSPVGYKLKNVRVSGDFNQKQLDEEIDKQKEVTRQMIEYFLSDWDKKNTLVFCVGVRHALLTQEILNESGVSSSFISSDMKVSERERLFNEYRASDFNHVLVSVDTMTTGVDLPNTFNLVILRPVGSYNLYSQLVGRGVRKHPSKEFCSEYDFGFNRERLGSYRNISNVVLLDIKERRLLSARKCILCGGELIKRSASSSKFLCSGCGEEYIICICKALLRLNEIKQPSECPECLEPIFKTCSSCGKLNFNRNTGCDNPDCNFKFGEGVVSSGFTQVKLEDEYVARVFSMKETPESITFLSQAGKKITFRYFIRHRNVIIRNKQKQAKTTAFSYFQRNERGRLICPSKIKYKKTSTNKILLGVCYEHK